MAKDELLKLYWVEKRPIFWHRCAETNKIIWPGQKVMLGRFFYKINYTMIPAKRWVTKEGYLLLKLKNKDQYYARVWAQQAAERNNSGLAR